MTQKASFIEFLHSTNPWWESSSFQYNVINRPTYTKSLESDPSKLIKILIGARRVGKTSILQRVINQIIKKANDTKKIIYLGADFRDIKGKGILKSLEFIAENLKLNLYRNKLYVFIDEAQEIKGWQNEVKTLYDHSNIRFFISGSSSLLLRKETSKLTGRYLLKHVLPLSYNEYLSFKKKEHSSRTLETYLQNGGYPEYVLTGNKSLLLQTIESTMYRELIDVYGIRNPAFLRTLIEYMADKVTIPISANRIAKDLKVDDKTASFYLSYLVDVFLLYPVYKKGGSHKKTKTSLPKYYFNDTGVLSLLSLRTRIGHLLENIVFTKLLQQNKRNEYHQIFYDVLEGQEIDFHMEGKHYEAKNSPTQIDVNQYESLKEVINIIHYEKTKNPPYLSNLRYQELGEFLLKKKL